MKRKETLSPLASENSLSDCKALVFLLFMSLNVEQVKCQPLYVASL